MVRKLLNSKNVTVNTVTAQLPPEGTDWTGIKTFTTSHNGEAVIRTLRWKTPVRYHGKVLHVVEMEDKTLEGEHAYYSRWITNVKPIVVESFYHHH